VLGLGLLLPLVPVQAQQPQDSKDDRDQQIDTLKKVLQALEQQKRAEHAVNEAQEFRNVREIELKKAMEQQHLGLERAKQAADLNQRKLAEELDRLKKDHAKQQGQAEEQVRHAVRFLQEAQLAQNQDPEQRRSRVLRLNVDDKNPDVQKAMHAIEEITKMVEMKRQELRGLEEKLQHAHAELQHMRAESARVEERRIEMRTPEGAPGREPIILKIDPSANWEQVKKQVEEIQSKSKQPIRVEIVNPGPGPVNIGNRAEPAPAEVRFRLRETKDPQGSNLEEKLERIMKEVEELRRELHDSRNRKVN
jgi:hypothetical protein